MAKKILIVEDNIQDQKIIKRNLVKHGYENLIFALTGEDAIVQAKSEKPDLIILDINLPKMSGVEVHMILKNDDATRHIPIILNTNLLAPNDFYEDMNLFISKTSPTEDLIKTIKMILGN